MEQGRELTWRFAMYGLSIPVKVLAVETNRRILIEWGDPATTVEWGFEARSDDTTLVTISNRGFAGSDDEVIAQTLDSMGGFSYLLAGAKA